MPDWRKDIGETLAGLKADIGLDAPLATHTTFGIGGPADMLVTAHERKALAAVLAACQKHDIDWWVLGRGSNVLISDSGLRGVVVTLGKEFGYVKVKDNVLTAGAGAGLDDIAVAAERAGLRGAEFLAGIPGTIGTFVTRQPWTARYIVRGVLPARETPTSTISASGHPDGFRPSSCVIAKSIADTRSK